MPEHTEAPRRLRAADVIDAQQAIIEQLLTRSPREPYVTVEHTLNAKGDTQTSVSVAASLGFDVAVLNEHAANVERIAAETYDVACNRHPRTNGETK